MLIYVCSNCCNTIHSYSKNLRYKGNLDEESALLSPSEVKRQYGKCPYCGREFHQHSPVEIEIKPKSGVTCAQNANSHPAETNTPRCECGGELVYDSEHNIVVCSRCGMVVDDRPLQPDVPRNTDPRYSGKLTQRMHDYGIGTSILPPKRAVMMGYAWSVHQARIVTSEHKRLIRILEMINEFGKTDKTPDSVLETASFLARRYIETSPTAKISSTTTLKCVALATIYIGYRLHGYTIGLKEFAKRVGEPPTMIWKGLTKLAWELGVKIPSVKVADYVCNLATTVGADPDVVALACRISSLLNGSCSKPPRSVAASALYVAGVLLDKKISKLSFETKGVRVTRTGLACILENLTITIYI